MYTFTKKMQNNCNFLLLFVDIKVIYCYNYYYKIFNYLKYLFKEQENDKTRSNEIA